MPLHRRLPKRGFVNIFRKEYRTVNVERLNGLKTGTTVTPDVLQGAGLVKKGREDVKVLGHGDLKVALTIQAHKFSKTAVQKIEAAGGKVEKIEVAVRKPTKKTGAAGAKSKKTGK